MDASTATRAHLPKSSAPRNFKASELPLTSATRASIESLTHKFKKEGAYDLTRKQVWEKFSAGDYEAEVTKAILEVAEKEVERNPQQLLTLDRSKAAALIDGALERSGVYQKAHDMIAELIDLKAIEDRLREIRKEEIGEEAAEAERQRGSKTDEEYTAETDGRRVERQRIRDELHQKEVAIEEEKRRIAKEERKKEEKRQEEAELKRQAERDERRRKREKEREEREKERDEEREKRHRERESRDDRRRDYDRDHDRDRHRDRDRDHKSREEVPKDFKDKLSTEELERLEKEAMDALTRESNRGTRRQQEVEIDASLAPPPRKTAPTSAINPIRRDSRNPTSRKASDSGIKVEVKTERDGSRTPFNPKMADLRSDRRHSTPERAHSRDHGRRDSDRRRDRDDRSRSPRRDPSRSRLRDRRDRSRSGTRRDDRRERASSRDRDRSRRRDRSRSRIRSDRRDRSYSRNRDRSRSRHRRDRTRSRQRRDDSRSRQHPDRYEPRVRDRSREPDRDREKDRDRERDAERQRDKSRDRRRDRSRDQQHRDRDRDRPLLRDKDNREEWKQLEVKKREKEAKAYLAAQQEARKKGLPIPGISDRVVEKPVDSRGDSDRYLPGGRRDDDRERRRTSRSRSRHRDRDRDRDRDHPRDRDRDDRTRDRNRDRDYDRDRDRDNRRRDRSLSQRRDRRDRSRSRRR